MVGPFVGFPRLSGFGAVGANFFPLIKKKKIELWELVHTRVSKLARERGPADADSEPSERKIRSESTSNKVM